MAVLAKVAVDPSAERESVRVRDKLWKDKELVIDSESREDMRHTFAEVMHGPIGQNVSKALEKLICGGGWVPMRAGSICHFLIAKEEDVNICSIKSSQERILL